MNTNKGECHFILHVHLLIVLLNKLYLSNANLHNTDNNPCEIHEEDDEIRLVSPREKQLPSKVLFVGNATVNRSLRVEIVTVGSSK